MDKIHLANYCNTDALNPSLCASVRQSRVNFYTMDLRLAVRDNEDKRIKFAMAVDPAPVGVFEINSFPKISISVVLVNLGQSAKVSLTDQAEKIAKTIPNANYALIQDASHYSIFAECKSGATELAEAEQVEDPFCKDGDGRSRHEIHEELINMTTSALDQALNKSSNQYQPTMNIRTWEKLAER